MIAGSPQIKKITGYSYWCNASALASALPFRKPVRRDLNAAGSVDLIGSSDNGARPDTIPALTNTMHPMGSTERPVLPSYQPALRPIRAAEYVRMSTE